MCGLRRRIMICLSVRAGPRHWACTLPTTC